jgi:hypothetical protein
LVLSLRYCCVVLMCVNCRVYTLDCTPPCSFYIGFRPDNDRHRAESCCCNFKLGRSILDQKRLSWSFHLNHGALWFGGDIICINCRMTSVIGGIISVAAPIMLGATRSGLSAGRPKIPSKKKNDKTLAQRWRSQESPLNKTNQLQWRRFKPQWKFQRKENVNRGHRQLWTRYRIRIRRHLSKILYGIRWDVQF